VISVQINTAQLPSPDRSQDRVFITKHAAIVLDGATAFTLTEIDAATYADALGQAVADQLRAEKEVALSDAVAHAINKVAHRFDLRAGTSPSSTIAILRARGALADLYVLGDSPIYYGTGDRVSELIDTRLIDLHLSESCRYRTRLREGTGYDAEHQALLKAMQERQRASRNTRGGYWIAEADPSAAYYGLALELTPRELSWAVLATDGITQPLMHAGQPDWPTIAAQSPDQLADMLAIWHDWERTRDPSGYRFPRAKRHDDKAIAAIASVWDASEI